MPYRLFKRIRSCILSKKSGQQGSVCFCLTEYSRKRMEYGEARERMSGEKDETRESLAV